MLSGFPSDPMLGRDMASHLPSPIPRIGPRPEGEVRPFWSVMIPTYNRFEYLGETLRSILAQDPGQQHMQIAVVDDCSTAADPEVVLRDLGVSQRVELFRLREHVSISSAWNQCIENARGSFVHIMHSDDLVLPGYYERLRAAFEAHPEAAMAFCRVRWIDADSHPTIVGPLEMPTAGLLRQSVLETLSVTNRIQCPAVVVRRGIYETLGGFRDDLYYALDWEMWLRIGWNHPVWYESEILFSWREHAGSETARLTRNNKNLADMRNCIGIINEYLPPARRKELRQRALSEWGYEAVWHARGLLQGRLYSEALQSVGAAWRYGTSLRVLRGSLMLVLWYFYTQIRKLLGRPV